jgi:hypothetical protein
MRRLIDIPGHDCREPSASLLRRLHEMDALTEVAYLGQGNWWLGRVREDSARRSVGRAWALKIREGDGFDFDEGRWHSLRHALLLAQGWSVISELRIVNAEEDGIIVGELQRALFVQNGGVLMTTEEIVAESARRDRIRESKVRERDMAKWLWSRSPNGRGNPWVSYARSA